MIGCIDIRKYDTADIRVQTHFNRTGKQNIRKRNETTVFRTVSSNKNNNRDIVNCFYCQEKSE